MQKIFWKRVCTHEKEEKERKKKAFDLANTKAYYKVKTLF